MKCQQWLPAMLAFLSTVFCHLGLWHKAMRICEPFGKSLCHPIQMARPLANGFSLLSAIQGQLVLGPLVFGFEPETLEPWLDAILTAIDVPLAPNAAKWAPGAWCAIIAKVLGLGLARLATWLGNSLLLYFACSLGLCLGRCLGLSFRLAFGTSFCFGQLGESVLLILCQISGF